MRVLDLSDVVRKDIILSDFAPEQLIAIPEELSARYITEQLAKKPAPLFCLVYKFRRQLSPKEYLYEFVGARLK